MLFMTFKISKLLVARHIKSKYIFLRVLLQASKVWQNGSRVYISIKTSQPQMVVSVTDECS